MKPLLLLLMQYLLLVQVLYYQNQQIDSLKAVSANQREDTSKVNTLNELCKALAENHDYTNAIVSASTALSLSLKTNFKKGTGDSHKNIGWIYSVIDNYPEA